MKGILINYEFCTGCHSCEVACKKHLELPAGEFGIKLSETGPFEYAGKTGADHWEWTYLPVMTKACDMCEDRTAKGKLPMCVQHWRGACTTARWRTWPRRWTVPPAAPSSPVKALLT